MPETTQEYRWTHAGSQGEMATAVEDRRIFTPDGADFWASQAIVSQR